jgi:N-acyl-D-amino-acid deacylase
MFDTLIKNAHIIDGSGRAGFLGDVGIVGEWITAVGNLKGMSHKRQIDGSGLVLTPGFIDAHGHSDFALVYHPEASSQVAQGVTTEVIGNCGFSAYPINEKSRNMLYDNDRMNVDWGSCKDYFQRLTARGIGINILPLVGHNTLRASVIGKQDRPCTENELNKMKGILREAIKLGVFGLSTGLQYTPGMGACEDEILELLKVFSHTGGHYSTHIASYSYKGIMKAIESALRIAHLSGLPLSISHLIIHGERMKGKAQMVLDVIQKAKEKGVNVCADVIPYPTIGVWWSPRAVFPEWAYEWDLPWDKAVEKLKAMIKNPYKRDELRKAIIQRQNAERESFYGQFFKLHDWDTIFLMGTAEGSPDSVFIGKHILEISRSKRKDPIDVYLDLVLNEGKDLSTVSILTTDEDYKKLIQSPFCMFGSDAMGISAGFTQAPYSTIQVHPRHFGHAVHVIEEYVINKGWLTLSEAIKKMTSFPADHFNIAYRGLIRPGYKADIVMFSIKDLKVTGTYLKPNRYPQGIEYVFVNGVEAVWQKELTGYLGGSVLSKNH